jgi:hypothetical protein
MSTYSIVRSTARVLAQRFGVALVVMTGILGLSRVGFQTARPAPENLPDDPPESGTVARVEVTAIWLVHTKQTKPGTSTCLVPASRPMLQEGRPPSRRCRRDRAAGK